MSRQFQIERNPYDLGYNLYEKSRIIIEPGVTVLVGCNGIGKSTLLRDIYQTLQTQSIAHIFFDNLSDGGSNATDMAGFFGDYEFVAKAISLSEGENIVLNLGNYAGKIGQLVRENEDCDEIWVLMDACDSGLSIDNVLDVKHLFDMVIQENLNTDIYIVVSANEYEMASGENCFDVYNGKYVRFNSYEEYKDMICKSREEKDNRERRYT